mgnify:CR=1 FL=1
MNPLHLVADGQGGTHLAISSPAIIGATPTERIVLCGSADYGDAQGHIADVECADCLFTSQLYWGLPSWHEVVA